MHHRGKREGRGKEGVTGLSPFLPRYCQDFIEGEEKGKEMGRGRWDDDSRIPARIANRLGGERRGEKKEREHVIATSELLVFLLKVTERSKKKKGGEGTWTEAFENPFNLKKKRRRD